VGALGVFVVSFLRGTLNYRESQVLAAAAVSVAAALGVTTRIGPLVDRVGSRPVLAVCLATVAAAAAGWWAIAAGLIPGSPWLVLLLHALAGAAGVGYYIGNSRLSMATIPLMGRNHFFALFTVITSLGLAASPLAWGIILDAIGVREFAALGVDWNRYAVLFAASALISAGGAGMVGLLREPSHSREEHHEATVFDFKGLGRSF
jgi:MFS family permease